MRPVDPGQEHGHLIEFAKEQDEYQTLVARVPHDAVGTVVTRWQLSDEERSAISAGADLCLEVLTFGQRLQPVKVFVAGLDPDEVGEERVTPSEQQAVR